MRITVPFDCEGDGMRIDVNGRRMFFDVEGTKLVPEGPVMRERPTVVLLHGGPGQDHSTFRPAFDRLAADAQLIYLDHSGQGRGDATGPDQWLLTTWADDVATFCESLELQHPIVLGYSFGGMVAQTLAARYPDLPSKLVLLSTLARQDFDRIEMAFGRVGGAEAGAAARAFFTGPTPETTATFYAKCRHCYSPAPLDPDWSARAVTTPALIQGGWTEWLTFDTRAGLPAITCPTLILNGAVDPVAPIEAGEEILSCLSAGVGRLETFPASGHMIQDTEPDRLFALLHDFITSS